MVHDGHTRGTFRLHFEPNHLAASSARWEARQVLEACGVPSDVVADLELIIAELASNAVEQEPGSAVRLEVEVCDESVMVTMTNQAAGPDRPVEPSGPPGESSDGEPADRGWGLAIVGSLSDGLWIEEDDQSISVRIVRRYGARQ